MEMLGCEDCPLWLPLGLLCLVLLLAYGYYPMTTWKRLGVPGPSPLPFIGHMHQFLNPKTGIRTSVSKWQKQYGKVFGIQFFRKPCLVVTDPDLFNEILVKEFHVYQDRWTLGKDFIPAPVMGGLAFQTGNDWKRNRKIMTPTFTAGKLKLLMGYMNTTAMQLARKLEENTKSGKITNAKDVFSAFSLDVMAGTAFGLEINSQDNQDEGMYEKAEAIFKLKNVLKLAMALAGMFPFTEKIMRMMNVSIFDPESVEYFRKYFKKLIDERKRHREEFETWDFFKLLLDAEAEEGCFEKEMNLEQHSRMLKTEEIVCHGITFIMAGYETTSSTLQFVSYFLARNQDVQDKLLEEIKTVFPDSALSDDIVELSYEHCQQLKYTEAVLYEALRMFPPVLEMKREANRDTTLAGIPVPKGTGIFIPVYNVGRDPTLFKDPNTFRPERFLTDDSTSSSSSSPSFKPVHFLPFGFGPRGCIGMRLAMMEMKIALVHVLKKVRFRNVQPIEIDLEDYTGLLTPKEPFKITMSLSE